MHLYDPTCYFLHDMKIVWGGHKKHEDVCNRKTNGKNHKTFNVGWSASALEKRDFPSIVFGSAYDTPH